MIVEEDKCLVGRQCYFLWNSLISDFHFFASSMSFSLLPRPN